MRVAAEQRYIAQRAHATSSIRGRGVAASAAVVRARGADYLPTEWNVSFVVVVCVCVVCAVCLICVCMCVCV